MIVHSVNIGKKQKIKYRGHTIETGIYKNPINSSIFLGEEDVKHDQVVDRRYHGGVDKACYLYSFEAYEYWEEFYPNLNMKAGFFGENITVKKLNEKEIKIGNQYQIGDAIIEVSQPREPCFKLGIKFETQKIISQFIGSPYPGIYVRVLQSGLVNKNDQLKLLKTRTNELSVLKIFELIYGFNQSKLTINMALNSNYLAKASKEAIKKRVQKQNLI